MLILRQRNGHLLGFLAHVGPIARGRSRYRWQFRQTIRRVQVSEQAKVEFAMYSVKGFEEQALVGAAGLCRFLAYSPMLLGEELGNSRMLL